MFTRKQFTAGECTLHQYYAQYVSEATKAIVIETIGPQAIEHTTNPEVFDDVSMKNWDLVARLDELEQLGLPILVGASRKRFLAAALNEQDPSSVSTQRRDVATAVLTALLLQRKLWGIRVHNVETTVDAIKVVSALKGNV